jgi:hypothetical protein
MSDFFTIPKIASGADHGKAFSVPNLVPLSFLTPKYFTFEKSEVHDLSSLFDVLQSFESEPTKTFI